MIGAKNFIGSLIDWWLQKWSNCKMLSWDSLKPQKETSQERIFKSTQRFLFCLILTLWPKSWPIACPSLHKLTTGLRKFWNLGGDATFSQILIQLFFRQNPHQRLSHEVFQKVRFGKIRDFARFYGFQGAFMGISDARGRLKSIYFAWNPKKARNPNFRENHMDRLWLIIYFNQR